MTIYLDIVLFENILLNYIIILSTAIISKEKINFIRIILSSILGGIFAILSYIERMPTFIEIVTKITISIIMMNIAFRKLKIKNKFGQTKSYSRPKPPFGLTQNLPPIKSYATQKNWSDEYNSEKEGSFTNRESNKALEKKPQKFISPFDFS